MLLWPLFIVFSLPFTPILTAILCLNALFYHHSVNIQLLNYASLGLRVETQFTGMQFSNGLDSTLERI